MYWEFLKTKADFVKSKKNSLKIFVKEFIFDKVADC